MTTNTAHHRLLNGHTYVTVLEDAATAEQYDTQVSLDIHGLSVCVGDTELLLDLSDGRLRVFVIDENGEVSGDCVYAISFEPREDA